MNYTLHQLQVFTKVVQLKSITIAAHQLFLTQPGVSIQLKNFQDNFDIPLTELIGRQLYITEFGYEIATIASGILEQFETINQKTAAFKGMLAGRLKIAVVSTGKYVMPYFLSGFLNEHPDIDITMDVTNRDAVIKSLEHNDVDFGLVSILPNKLSVEEELLLENKLFLIGNANYHVGKKIKNASDLANIPLIYREVGSATRMIMENFLDAGNIIVKKKIELTSNEAVKQAVIAGMGYSVMPVIGIRNEIANGELEIIPVPGFPIRSQWRLIWLKGKKFSPVAKAFIAYLQQNKTTVISRSFGWINQ